jgi:outer membrane lipase/esterase
MSFLFSMRRAFRLGALLLSLAALASCGGGGEVVEFKPTRILAFGDELSVITPAGLKYSVNAYGQKTENGVLVDDPTVISCVRNPLWIQSVADAFDLVFDRCLGGATSASGQILAQVGAKVADLPAQVAAVQGAARNELDLALVLVGMNDILELYAQFPTVGRDALIAEARTRGAALGNQVNALATSGPAVVVLTVPDLSLTPLARQADTAAGDTSRSTLLKDLVNAFNNRMSVTLINDGRLIGLVYADVETQNMAKFPSTYGLANVIDAACLVTAPLPDCNPGTLVTGATAAGHMWADSVRPGPTVQGRLGVLAASRATGNPF